MIAVGGFSFILGAVSFVAVFTYLAASFDYPDILDGHAADVLPRLHAGGALMRATWALYACLPLLLIPGAIGAYCALPASRARMTLALVVASLGAFAMCLGLMRWPSVHWALADAYSSAGRDSRSGLEAVFNGLNLYLGNYIGEFLGETLLAVFFLLSAASLLDETRLPKWIGWSGVVFAVLFMAGAFRNIETAVQPIADLNNVLLPLWMMLLGAALLWLARHRVPTASA
jgi:hypothetical protein